MTFDETSGAPVEKLLDTPDLADALESEQFKRFLDQVPIAISVSDLKGHERIVYANPEFEKLSGLPVANLADRDWSALGGEGLGKQKQRPLSVAVVEDSDCVGTFKIDRVDPGPAVVDVYSNVIHDDEGVPCFRLVALVNVTAHDPLDRQALQDRIRDKDTLLLELQHRVKNNLQMITALIRLETRNTAAPERGSFERLAGRIESLAILYRSLTDGEYESEVDLGTYLAQIASAVMKTHAVEGIRLDMKLDTFSVSVNVAMPTGLVVNELLTNALKHAFKGGQGGTITLRSTVDGDGCRVMVADDGIGLPDGVVWPKPGKLGALIAQSLRDNAKAEIEVESEVGAGTKVTMLFRRSAATGQIPAAHAAEMEPAGS